jgi:formylglycine-generating enzyme required for sulfatase activity
MFVPPTLPFLMARAGARFFRTWAPFGALLGAVGCAAIVDLTGDYHEGRGGEAGESGEGSGGSMSGGSTSGSSGTTGGSEQGGSANGGTEQGGSDSGGGGDGPSGGSDPGGRGGSSGAGRGGAEPTGGASGAGMGGAGMGGAGMGGAGMGGAGMGGAGTGGSGAGFGGTSGAPGGAGSGGTGGIVLPPPSCDGGLRTCGPSGDLDCCSAPLVPAGEFDRGNDANFPATLHAFRLDAYEVTVGRFRKFSAAFAAGYRPDPGDGKNANNPADGGWNAAWDAELPANGAGLTGSSGPVPCDGTLQTWTVSPGGNESRPINCVSWYVANAFCIWDRGRLPTEAEWNYAAAGGDHQRVYPWSSPPSATVVEERHASFYMDSYLQCRGDYVNGCTVADMIPVGTRFDGDAEFGHADMAGNVYEWVQDGFAAYANPCADCANLTAGPDRTIRGGSYSNFYALLRTDFRLNWPPELPSSGVGIRCARAE